MGWVTHNAIVVTSWSRDLIDAAHAEAKRLTMSVSDVLISPVNTYYTFVVGPDGSKTGWDDSDAGDTERQQFRDWLRSQAYEDGSSSLEWCECEYGSDDRKAKIVHSQWRKESTTAGRAR